MPLTNYPNGVTSFGIPIFGASVSSPPVTGSVLFVDTVNGVDAGSGNSPTAPYKTLTYALSQSAANGTIYIAAGSTITVSSATALPITVAGVTIVGMGTARNRPLFDFTTANTATIAVSAGNVSFINCRFRASFLSVAACFTLTTAVGFTIQNNVFFDNTGILNFLNVIQSTGIDNTTDNLTAVGNIWHSSGTTSVNSFILAANGSERYIINNNIINQVTTVDAAALLTITAGVITSVDIGYNRVYRKNTATTAGALISLGGTTSTGMVYNNYVQTLDTSTPLLVTGTVGLGLFNNYVSGAYGTSGTLNP